MSKVERIGEMIACDFYFKIIKDGKRKLNQDIFLVYIYTYLTL